MIKPEQIPDEVAWKLHDKLWSVGGSSVDDTRAAIAAALSAWPGIEPAMQMSNDDWTTLRGVRLDGIILPLTEKTDDKA